MSSFEKLKIGKKAPDVVHAVIEIPKGSTNKYEIDLKTGLLFFDRALSPAMHYPADYGFIAETLSPDGGNLDIMIIGSDPIFPCAMVEARPVGILKMTDHGGVDYKVLAVQKGNVRLSTIQTFAHLQQWNPHVLQEIEDFFNNYKRMERNDVILDGWGDEKFAKDWIMKEHEEFLRGKDMT